MVIVPAGRFLAGSSPEEIATDHVDAVLAAREQPPKWVEVARPFAMSRYPVTREEYARFIGDTHWAMQGPCAALEDGPSNRWTPRAEITWQQTGFHQTGRHPVVCVNFDDVNAYVDWLSRKTGRKYRLPSGAEWEYAARGGARTSRYWGDDRKSACLYANVSDIARANAQNKGVLDPEHFFPCLDRFVETSPVGAFRPNAFGFYDVEGNVWQWTADCLNSTLENAPSDTRLRVTGDCNSHEDRGGSWTNSPKYLRLAVHHGDLNGARTTVLGFRVVREID